MSQKVLVELTIENNEDEEFTTASFQRFFRGLLRSYDKYMDTSDDPFEIFSARVIDDGDSN